MLFLQSLVLNMTITLFIRTVVCEQCILFQLKRDAPKIDVPNSVTAAEIEKGRLIDFDKSAKGYHLWKILKQFLNHEIISKV